MLPSRVLSIVVVAYGMERELPRTLRSLTRPYQRGVDGTTLEIIVVDNGSPQALAPPVPPDPDCRVLIHRVEEASVSPAPAANIGIGLATGDLVGLVIDGARMASPGLLQTALLAASLGSRTVVTAPAWHLGPSLQIHAATTGYDQTAEDQLLTDVGWEQDGYGLFSISTPAASSGRGLFGPMGESSSLFLSRALWDELGGLDERFRSPGGGLVNHDLYRRACQLPDVELVVMLGEGTFHQLHGGAATSGRVTREAMRAEYEAICGSPHRPPSNQAVYVGSVPSQYLPYLEASIDLAAARGTGTTGQPVPEGG